MELMQARKVSLWLLSLGVIMSIVSSQCGDNERAKIVLGVMGLALIGASVVIEWTFYKCPHCHRYLGRSTGGDYCQYCGKSLWEKP